MSIPEKITVAGAVFRKYIAYEMWRSCESQVELCYIEEAGKKEWYVVPCGVAITWGTPASVRRQMIYEVEHAGPFDSIESAAAYAAIAYSNARQSS